MLCVSTGMCAFSHREYSSYGICIRRVYPQGRGFTGYIPFRVCLHRVWSKGRVFPGYSLWNKYTPCVVTGAKVLRAYSFPEYTYAMRSYRGEFFLLTRLYPFYGICISRVCVFTRAEFTKFVHIYFLHGIFVPCEARADLSLDVSNMPCAGEVRCILYVTEYVYAVGSHGEQAFLTELLVEYVVYTLDTRVNFIMLAPLSISGHELL